MQIPLILNNIEIIYKHKINIFKQSIKVSKHFINHFINLHFKGNTPSWLSLHRPLIPSPLSPLPFASMRVLVHPLTHSCLLFKEVEDTPKFTYAIVIILDDFPELEGKTLADDTTHTRHNRADLKPSP